MQVQRVQIYNHNNPNSIYQYKHTNHSVNNHSKNNISFGSKLMLDFGSLPFFSGFSKMWQKRFINGLNLIESIGNNNIVLVGKGRYGSCFTLEHSCYNVPHYAIGIKNEEGSHYVELKHMITTPKQERYRTASVPERGIMGTIIDFSEYQQIKNIPESDVSKDMESTYKAAKKQLDECLDDDAVGREYLYEKEFGNKETYQFDLKKAKIIKERISKLTGELGIIDESKGNYNNPIVLQPDFWLNLEHRRRCDEELTSFQPLRWWKDETFETVLKEIDSLKDLKHDNIICIGYKRNREPNELPLEFMTMSIIEKRGDKIFTNEEPIDAILYRPKAHTLVDYYHKAHEKLVQVPEEDSEIYNYYYDLVYKKFKPQSNKSDTIKETAKEVSKQPIISDSEKTEKVSQSNILDKILDKIKGLSKEEFEVLYKQMTELHQSKG